MQLEHFSPSEFACADGCGKGFEDMRVSFVKRLDRARDIAGIPFVLTSAIRCEKHNRAVVGVEGSAHTKGLAVDIAAVGSRARFLIVSALLECGFHRIGIAETFIHVDADRDKDADVVWLYE